MRYFGRRGFDIIMVLKRKKCMVLLVSIFIITWLVIALYVPSPSPGRLDQLEGGQQEGRLKLMLNNKPNNVPKIRILDHDGDRPQVGNIGQKQEPAVVDSYNGAQERDGFRPVPHASPPIDPNAPFDIERDVVPHELPAGSRTLSAVWTLAASWVSAQGITQPENPDLGAVMNAMMTRSVIAAEVGYKGTQLKARLVLAGGQWVVFKPGRYKRNQIIHGTPYAGYDRHNGEIAAFHLDRVLGFRRAPIVVGRRLNISKEVKPVASRSLLDTFMTQGNRTCFYGKCYYCNAAQPACSDEQGIMEGSLTLWLPTDRDLKKWAHPWARTYRDEKKARWEYDNSYCTKVLLKFPLDKTRRLADILDTAVLDFIIGNADRHQYETFEQDGDQGMLLLMDNAKSFGNPGHDEMSILAPIKQCCKLRNTTWQRMLSLRDGELSGLMRRVLSHDPLTPVLTEPHLEAMDRRLTTAINVVNDCLQSHGQDNVLIT